MKVLITGVCGFVGSILATSLKESGHKIEVWGIDNFFRAGSEHNRLRLQKLGVKILHGDIRNRSDLETIPAVDWVIDAAANPSVLAGVDSRQSSRQAVENNLLGTAQMLEFCKERRAGFLLLSTSRVYSIHDLLRIPLRSEGEAFAPDSDKDLPSGIGPAGLIEEFSTTPPLSIYGTTKKCSELLALEYAEAFEFPIRINRCGVLAGAGQFGRADQGIFSFWIHSWATKRALKYIGFEGNGFQVRDCLHPADLAMLVLKQLLNPDSKADPILNVSGGSEMAMSLRQLSRWCEDRLGTHTVLPDNTERPYDIPWMVLDSQRARQQWDWAPKKSLDMILEEIAIHAKENPQWLEITS